MSDYIAYSLLIITNIPQILYTIYSHKKARVSFVKDGPKETLLKIYYDFYTKVYFT